MMTQDELREIATKALELAVDRKDACEKEDILRVGPAVVAWNNHAVKYHSILAQAVLAAQETIGELERGCAQREAVLRDTQNSFYTHGYNEAKKQFDQSAEIERLRAALEKVESYLFPTKAKHLLIYEVVLQALANQPKQQTPRREERRKSSMVAIKECQHYLQAGTPSKWKPDRRTGDKK